MASPEPRSPPARKRDLVVIGASAGGVETLKRVVGSLPADLPAAVCIVLHIAPDTPSLLALILAGAGPLPCHAAREAERLQNGTILVAPPDRHLMVEDEHVHLSLGPRENGHRPAADVLFRSAAAAKGERAIGVILSGSHGDGALGLAAVKAAGGVTIVQDPDEALYPGMPSSALARVAADAVVPSDVVAQTIVAMISGDDPPSRGRTGDSRNVPDETGPGADRSTNSHEGLLDVQAVDVEASMWAAVRALEDRSRSLERMATHFEPRGHTWSAHRFRARARVAREQARTVRAALTRTTVSPTGDEAGEVAAERLDVRPASGDGTS